MDLRGVTEKIAVTLLAIRVFPFSKANQELAPCGRFQLGNLGLTWKKHVAQAIDSSGYEKILIINKVTAHNSLCPSNQNIALSARFQLLSPGLMINRYSDASCPLSPHAHRSA
jgi:hypothetical protein